jgi:hypothetical protein
MAYITLMMGKREIHDPVDGVHCREDDTQTVAKLLLVDHLTSINEAHYFLVHKTSPFSH